MASGIGTQVDPVLIGDTACAELEGSNVDAAIIQMTNRLRDSKSFSPPVLIREKPFSRVVTQVPMMPKTMGIFFFSEGGVRIYKIFSKIYNQKLPTPGMKSATVALVWRGCNPKDLINMGLMGAARGERVDVHAKPPSEEEIILQMGEVKKLPEFTFKESIAEHFGRQGCIVACEIDIKYLAQGSASESGVVCSEMAPVALVAWKLGKDFQGTKLLLS